MHKHFTVYFFLTFGILFYIHPSALASQKNPAWTSDWNSSEDETLSFRENKGQWDSDILYKLDISSMQIYAEKGQLTWAVHNIEELKKQAEYLHGGNTLEDVPIVHSHGFRMKFLNSNSDHGFYGQDASLSYSNYFIGDDPDKWASHVHDYKKITYTSLYDGIDFKLSSMNAYLKYEFIVDPGVDPSQIHIQYDGVDELNLVNGHLYVVTSVTEIKELAPYAYQIIDGIETEVPCFFQLDGKVLTYHLPQGYDQQTELIIDPTLVFASYTGSTADNWGMTATPGPNGELYGGGVVFGNGYPTIGAYDDSYNSSSGYYSLQSDIGITKFSADGSKRLYSTYLGGRYTDIPHSLIVNSQGDLIIMGTSSSDNYPTTPNAYNTTHSGGNSSTNILGIRVDGTDIVLSILSETGDELKGSTFIGGSQDDGIMYSQIRLVKNYGDQLRGEVNIDDADNIYVATVTKSTDFPIKSGFQQSFGGGNIDAVIFSLTPELSELRWSTYFGGTEDDAAYSINLDTENNIIVAGGTESGNLFNFSDVLQRNYRGNIDGYLLKISEDGRTLIKGTYLGTAEYDQIYFVDVSKDNEIFIYGQSEGNMPVSPDVYYNNGGGMIIQKISSELDTVLLATRIGTGRNILNLSPSAFLVDDCGRIFISGWGGDLGSGYNPSSTTTGLKVTLDAIQRTTDGADFYFLVLEEDAKDLIYATYFGGNTRFLSRGGEHVDGGTSRFSKDGVIYQAVCAGCGATNRFPTTPGAASTTHPSPNCNLGVIKIDFELNEIHAEAELLLGDEGCVPFPASFKNHSKGTRNFFWDFDNGKISKATDPMSIYYEPGIYQVKLIAISGNSCIESDTAYFKIRVNEAPEDTVVTINLCSDSTLELSSRLDNDDATYEWNTGETTPSIKVDESGIYYVIASLGNCRFRDTFHITYATPNTVLDSEVACGSGSINLIIDGNAENVNWNTGDTTTFIEITQPGEYIVSYDLLFCSYTDTAFITFPELPVIEIKGDTIACEGEDIVLEAINYGNIDIQEYQWSDGSINSTLSITEPGKYTVTGIDEYGCTASDTITVDFILLKPPLVLSDTTIHLCADEELTIDLSDYEDGYTEIIWSDGFDEYIRTFEKTGTYSVNITNRCQEYNGIVDIKKSPFKGSELPVYIPNAFTPNEDGVNDGFRPLFHPDISILSYEFEVFDRWGNKVFHTENPKTEWAGLNKEKELKPGVYVWAVDIVYSVCKDPIKKKLKGDITIFK